MTTNRKVLTGLAILIVLSLLVMPASVFAQGSADGAARVHRVIKPWKVRRMQFTVAEESGVYPAYGSMYVHDAECDNLLWSIPRVKCVTIDDGTAFFAGRGAGNKAGKFVLVVAKEGRQTIEVRATRNRRYFNYWCKHPSVHGMRSAWAADEGYISVAD